MTEAKYMLIAVIAIFVGAWIGTGIVMLLAWLHRRFN